MTDLEQVDSLPSSDYTDLDVHPCLRSKSPSLLPVEELVNDDELYKRPHWSRETTKFRTWTAQKSKEGYDIAEKAMRSSVQHARIWSARQSKESNDIARRKLRSGIQKAKAWGVRHSKENIHDDDEENDTQGVKSASVEIQRAIRERLQQAREECENTYLRPYVPSHDSGDESPYETQLPENHTWLPPEQIAVRIKLPLPRQFRSLDVPVASSVRNNYTCCTYFPETDTHFIPDEEGGPFEIPAARGENQMWLKPYPEQYWDFRSSALEELKHTGKLHWRKVDRWGVPWEESRWKEDIRPAWNPERRKWERSMMDL